MFLTSLPRIARFILAFVVFLFVLAAAAVGTLIYVLDEQAVKSTIDTYAKQALNARVEYDGAVELKHLTSLHVQIPALRFKDLESDAEIGSISGARADVALWSALLGAVNVNTISVSGAHLTLRVPHANGDSLFDEAFGSVRFPENLRVSNFHLDHARIDLTTGTDKARRAWKISALTLSSGRLSPEMTTPFEVSAHFEVVDPTTTTTPSAAGRNQESAPAPSEMPEQAASAAESSEKAEPQFSTETSTESTPAENQPDYVDTPAADTNEPPADGEPNDKAGEPGQAKQSVWNGVLIREAFAQESLSGTAKLFATFDPTAVAGDLSAKGILTLSVTDRYVMLEDVGFSGEISNRGSAWTTVAKADRLRFKGNELSGSNLSASLSQPADTTGDIHLGAVDFRLRPGVLESPEMRFSRTEERGNRISTFEVASSVRANFNDRTADFDNLTARVSLTGDEALPSDFNASVSGFIKADLKRNSAQVGLSGDFAGAPISFNGTIRNAEPVPELEGELMVGEINYETLPGSEMLAWMRHFDFSGAVRIGRISAAGMTGTQLNGTLAIKSGKAVIDSLVVNTAEGRLFGTFELAEDTSWFFNGRIDGVSLDQFIVPVAGASPVAGVANGDLTLTGKGFSSDMLAGTAKLRVLRPAYLGLDSVAVRNHLVTNADIALITRQGARTELDEATLGVTLANNVLTLKDILARSVYMRTKSDAAMDLRAGTVSGTSSITFAPQQGVPSIHLSAQISGRSVAPTWSFEWQRSAEALRRAQGKPVLPDKKNEKSIWQSVKEFFNF